MPFTVSATPSTPVITRSPPAPPDDLPHNDLPALGAISNTPGLPAAAATPSAALHTPSPLLTMLRERVMHDGAPMALTYCLSRASRQTEVGRAVLFRSLTLALSQDTALQRADAAVTYRGQAAASTLDHAAYRTAMTSLHHAVAACGVVLPGTYGFLQQSALCAARYDDAAQDEGRRAAISGWLNWQWAAVPAATTDPLMCTPGPGMGYRAVSIAYALDEAPAGLAILRALAAESTPPE